MPVHTILIVDDSVGNLKFIQQILHEYYKPVPVTSGRQALEYLRTNIPSLILLDIEMPEMNGYETIRQIKDDPRLATIPVVFFSALSDDESELIGLEYGAVDYIRKPVIPRLLLHRIRMQLELHNYRHHLEQLVREKTDQMFQLRKVTIDSLAGLAECRDLETGQHIKRTSHYVDILTQGLLRNPHDGERIDKEIADHIIASAPLHDIGKIGIPDSILNKPDRLNDEEFEIMKQHVLVGEATLRKAKEELGFQSYLDTALEMCATHHEHWDGTGYLKGLSGTDIPLAGRIMSIADVYDALVTKRVYKEAMEHEMAVEIIRAGRGTHYDPNLVDIFMDCEQKFEEIMVTYRD